LLQGIYHARTGNHIWEREARVMIAQFYTDAAFIKRLERINPKWVQRYVTDQGDDEWCVSTHNYGTFQATARGHKWKKYACFVLDYKDAPAERMWRAIHEIAKREGNTPGEVVTAIESHVSAVERLGEIVESHDRV